MPRAVFEGIFSSNARLFQLFEAEKKTGRSVFPMAQREEKSGFLLIDSTPLPVCENVRANRHRTF
ncbi:MAG: hypothetical protein LBF34_01125, partial [Puniceicoccales bacterium]|nr:hypothetical protein [Puniceicoccales bacterium]